MKPSSGTASLCLTVIFLHCVEAGVNGLMWAVEVGRVLTRELAEMQEFSMSFTVGRTREVRSQQAPHSHRYHNVFY